MISNKINKLNGFTLIELMIALAITGILVTMATIVYSSHVLKGRRVDGITSLLSISLAEERYRTTHTTYGTLAQVYGGVSSSQQGYYTLAITSNTATGYVITATAQGNQANDSENGTSCTTLTLTMSSGTITNTPSNCWPN